MGGWQVLKNTDEMLSDAIKNIDTDRALATKLLADLMKYLGSDESRHQYSGQVAAKYLETLQRSNEQLVKIAALKQKKQASESNLTDFDKTKLYDLMKEE